jgi:hypothetical protein
MWFSLRMPLSMSLPDTHLDIGCGKFPRNPVGRTRGFGVALRELPSSESFESRVANLSLEPIPYADDLFGSVPAFDFIEHIPRVLAVDGGRQLARIYGLQGHFKLPRTRRLDGERKNRILWEFEAVKHEGPP